ncbi:acyl-CoA desaturase [Subtercola sp. RTI3]|nr:MULTISPECIES: acyl-CoA desaturase [Subtercola]MEA9985453.1 acyl-CoA desaturase [Subtercola sp. RTI3]
MSSPSITPPVVTFTRTKPGGNKSNPTTEYSALLRTVRDAGLLRRRTGYYYIMFSALTLALGGVIVGIALLGDTWYQLIMAGLLGIILTQYAFLAHEASHRQVFESGKTNDVAGRMLANLFVGISYSWWMTKHSRHHANPNIIGKDPDIDRDVVSFTPEQAAQAKGIYGWFTRRQGTFFFPILVLEGLNLHLHGFRTVFGRGKVDKRAVEIVMLVSRIGLYVALIFMTLPLGMAFAFIGVQVAVFGVYMGSSFAPNHVGMPILPHDSKVDFLQRQVLTGRNISGGWFMNIFMGGLNYQVEHHLFPNMPRPALKSAQVIAREYCETHTILYTETTLPQAYAIVVKHLNKVGLSAASKEFACPAAASYGR